MIRMMRPYARIISFICAMVLTAWAVVAAFGGQEAYRAVFSHLDEIAEQLVDDGGTSTDYRYQERFENTLQRYPDFGALYVEEASTAIPGLAYTRLGDSYSCQMVPQGICFAGDYMLISAYDNGTDGEVLPSVLYVLSNVVGERRFLTTLVLPDANHVGGIAFDGTYVWIAKSTTGYLSGISYDLIQVAVETGEECFVVPDYSVQVKVGGTASFVTYDRDRLWVGTHAGKGEKGALSGYRLNWSDGNVLAVKEQEMELPSFAQGVAFVNDGGQDYMVVSSSYGRYRNSKIYLYEMQDTANGSLVGKPRQMLFPPMAEEVAGDGAHLYFLFESAATCYSAATNSKCAYPVDRVCAIDAGRLLSR